MELPENPYSPPLTTDPRDIPRRYTPAELRQLLDDDPLAGALQVRRRYIGHEAALRTVGLIYCVVGWLLILGIVASLVLLCVTRLMVNLPTWSLYVFVAALGLMWLYFAALGIGLRRLRRGETIAAGVVSGLDVAASTFVAILAANPFPLAHLPFDLLVLFLAGSTKTAVVLSDKYHAARRLTPDLPYPAGPALLVLFVYLLSLAGPVILAALLQPEILSWTPWHWPNATDSR